MRHAYRLINASPLCVMPLSVESNNENSVRAEVSVRLTCQTETCVTCPGQKRVRVSSEKTFFSVVCVSECYIIPILPIAAGLQSDAFNSNKYSVD